MKKTSNDSLLNSRRNVVEVINKNEEIGKTNWKGEAIEQRTRTGKPFRQTEKQRMNRT